MESYCDSGASLAVGTDTDPVAVRAASQNGVLNKFTGKWITLHCGPSVDNADPISSNPQGFLLPSKYDICVANILQVTSESCTPSCSANCDESCSDFSIVVNSPTMDLELLPAL